LKKNWLYRIGMVENGCIGERPVQLSKRKFGIPSTFSLKLLRRAGCLCYL
jgi:hypothetical protein